MASKPLSKKVTVVNNVGETLDLTNLRSSNPAFRVESKIIEAGKKAEITVTLLTPLKGGNNYGRITADTGVAESPTLSFASSAYVTAEVEVTPSAITVQGNLIKDTKRFVTIRNSGKTPLKVSDLTLSNPAITAELTETSPGKAFKIVLSIPAGIQLSAGGETIKIKTDNPRYPELSVPIRQRAIPTRRNPAATVLKPTKGRPTAARLTRPTAVPAAKTNAKLVAPSVKTKLAPPAKNAPADQD
ncbi:MAG: hypothetical protein O7D94_12745 [Planctomycetota bacterium]|nr:hypothetical protein [Planctomycetota bacterium]MCZ6699793.1 hypothetical protein [Planctomycetota bacterium]